MNSKPTDQESNLPSTEANRAERTASASDATSVGAVWLGVFGWLLVVEVATGVLLMSVYSPSTTTAWASVWYVQTQVDLGWLIRGVHRFAGDAMLLAVVAFILHVLIRRAYRPPRHVDWWVGWCLIGLVMFVALTGYLLPWDQRGYWGAVVRLNILSQTPVIGPFLKVLLLGGAEPGHLTLTRFYAMHVVILPGLMALLLRQSPSGRRRIVADGFRAVASLIAFGAVVAVAWFMHSVRADNMLSAPADPAAADYPARPEWFNLFLFQWLKGFHGPSMELFGAIVAPALVALGLFVVPFLDRLFRPARAHRAALIGCGALAVGVSGLTVAAVRADRDPPDAIVAALRERIAAGDALDASEARILTAREFNERVARARWKASRAMQLAERHGVPPEGPGSLFADDPLTRGPELFAANCAACHRMDGHNGLGVAMNEPAASSDLAGFASRDWIRGLLTDPMGERYLGRMKNPDGGPAHTRMAKWLGEMRASQTTDDQRKQFDADLDAVAAYLADESIQPGRLAGLDATDAPTSPDEQTIHHGRSVFTSVCNECHRYAGENTGTFRAPDMLGYGSVEWIERLIDDPSDDLLYRGKGREPARMPSFHDRLTESERRLIAHWLHESRGVREAVSDRVPLTATER